MSQMTDDEFVAAIRSGREPFPLRRIQYASLYARLKDNGTLTEGGKDSAAEGIPSYEQVHYALYQMMREPSWALDHTFAEILGWTFENTGSIIRTGGNGAGYTVYTWMFTSPQGQSYTVESGVNEIWSASGNAWREGILPHYSNGDHLFEVIQNEALHPTSAAELTAWCDPQSRLYLAYFEHDDYETYMPVEFDYDLPMVIIKALLISRLFRGLLPKDTLDWMFKYRPQYLGGWPEEREKNRDSGRSEITPDGV